MYAAIRGHLKDHFEAPQSGVSSSSNAVSFTIHTDHQALTTLLSTSGTGHHSSNRLRQYNFELQFTPGRLNVVADFFSRSVTCPELYMDTETVEKDMILMLHSPLQATGSLQEPKDAS